MALDQACGPAKPNTSPRSSLSIPGRLGLQADGGSAFLPPQHPKLVDAPPTGPGWVHEVKFDGYRMQLHVLADRCRWFSRNGHDWSSRLPDMSEIASELPLGVYDGELCALKSDGSSDFSALRSAMGRREAGRIVGDLIFYLFDLLEDASGDLRGERFSLRRELLAEAVEPSGHAVSPRLRLSQELPGGGEDLLKAACALKLEGIVSKRCDSAYEGGDRRPLTWRKSKCRPSQEVVIGGFEMDGARFRSLLAGVYEEGVFTYVGHVGTGFPRAVVEDLLPKLRAAEDAVSPFAAGSPLRKGVRWVRPELVAQVEIAEWNAAGKMRQASFKGLRQDKSATAVIRELA